MFTPEGRDLAWTHRTMAHLFAAAQRANMTPIVWELGFWNMRDLIGTRDSGFRTKSYEEIRMETVWGCGIIIDTFGDKVALLVRSDDGKSAVTHRLIAGEEE